MIYKLYHTKQSCYMATSSYLEKFTTQVEIIEAHGGISGYNEGMISTQLSLMNPPLDFATEDL